MNTTMPGRIATANEILRSYQPEASIYLSGGRLRVISGRYSAPADLRGQGDLPRYCKRWSGGGTSLQALGQLIRYVRDLNRLPIITWEYWASESIKLCNSETLLRIRESDYGDPAKTCCVLCGTTEFRGLDWWSLDGVTGPSCRYGRCRRDQS